MLHWARPAFVTAWSAIGLGSFLLYLWVEHVDLGVQLRRHWKGGVLIGILVGGLLWRQVGSQPPSARAEGVNLLQQLAGYGVLYGTVDALMLSVLPVLTLYGARAADGGPARLKGALAALVGSTLVTAAYHAGFEEYRGPGLAGPLIGNLIMTLGYLVSGSPIAPILSHIVMHTAAVLHGVETTIQLPPHP